uniref:RNA-directed DNA polymerase, eukaryota, reverse transcriptase zinc-binding domain protein n=1 Tax=Tanacetum cinerariifolium TaxID=118510 RepID=A0A6L2K0G2_TANCI|nr:RNA-directed DNA polymerase, eukaryota, reverse transcriptase zinc-binding domain protein [Tanacetum cinerariifolium]
MTRTPITKKQPSTHTSLNRGSSYANILTEKKPNTPCTKSIQISFPLVSNQLSNTAIVAELNFIEGAPNTHNIILDQGFIYFSIKYLGVAEQWGKILIPKDCSARQFNRSAGKVCILTDHLKFIMATMQIPKENEIITVRVSKVEGDIDTLFNGYVLDSSSNDDGYSSADENNEDDGGEDFQDGVKVSVKESDSDENNSVLLQEESTSSVGCFVNDKTSAPPNSFPAAKVIDTPCDFNEVRSNVERKGLIFCQKRADLYNDFIASSGLFDLPLCGMRYTRPWYNIAKLRDDLQLRGIDLPSLFKIKIGNGEIAKFWPDKWLGGPSLSETFPWLYRLEVSKDVRVVNRSPRFSPFPAIVPTPVIQEPWHTAGVRPNLLMKTVPQIPLQMSLAHQALIDFIFLGHGGGLHVIKRKFMN